MTQAQQIQALEAKLATVREQRYELMGVLADVENGLPFDDVCVRTLQRVINALA